MPKRSPPVNLDKYLKGREHTYISYEDGARQYSMPYWTFVKIAKEAKANWMLRKTAMVDLEIFDKYLDEHYCEEDDKTTEQSRKRGIDMPRARKPIENIEELVGSGKKKYVRYAEGAELYSMGKHSFEQIAKDAGAIRRVKGIVLVNTEKVDAFIETFEEEEY